MSQFNAPAGQDNRNVYVIPHKVRAVHTESSEFIPDGVKMVHAQSQWGRGNEGEGVVVAIIDTGVDYNHPDLKDNILGGKDFTGKGTYMDGNGHGTHVAGTIAAADNGSGIVGVAPKAKILALKALDDDGSGDMSTVVAAINYAITQKVHVINMSLGGAHSNALHKAVQAAVKAGIIVCAASGNEGDGDPNTEELSYPGAYPEVLEVGAVDYSGRLAYFSNTNKEVDVLAPGVNVYSTYPGGKYAYLDGTSMATPHMSGAAALLLSNNPDDYKNGSDILDLSKESGGGEDGDSNPGPTPNPMPKKPPLAPKVDRLKFLLKLLLLLLGSRRGK